MTGQYGMHRALSVVAFTLLATACATPSRVAKILHDPAYYNRTFSNILVIGVADNYDARAQFERQMVSAIKAAGSSATAYYTVIGHNPPITRSDVSNAVRARKFDAVLITRLKGQETEVEVVPGSTEAKTTRRSGTAFDLFRYDYEVLNEPDSVQLNTTVALITELYDAAAEKKIWAVETTAYNQNGVADIIDSEVDAIVGQLRKDKLIGR